jgi:uncharacterized protein (TIGR04255 family)
MTERPADLPDFDMPPLTEVALSLQFQPIARLGFVDLGPLSDQFRPPFERVEYHPPLAPVFETFGLRQGMVQTLHLGTGMTIPRLWLINKGGNELLQFQVDRFGHNWRKIEVDNIYPRYEQIRERFEAEVQTLTAFLSQRDLGALVPTQCEVTYVNTIGLSGGGDPTHKVLPLRQQPHQQSHRPVRARAFSCPARTGIGKTHVLGVPRGMTITFTILPAWV